MRSARELKHVRSQQCSSGLLLYCLCIVLLCVRSCRHKREREREREREHCTGTDTGTQADKHTHTHTCTHAHTHTCTGTQRARARAHAKVCVCVCERERWGRACEEGERERLESGRGLSEGSEGAETGTSRTVIVAGWLGNETPASWSRASWTSEVSDISRPQSSYTLHTSEYVSISEV